MLTLPRIFRKAKRTEVIAATVRPWEVTAETRREQMTHADLIRRYVGWVYVAASRNATDVASVPVRVYSRKAGPSKKVWGGRSLGRKRYAAVKHYAGPHARKAFGGYDTDEVVEITDPTHPVVALFTRCTPWASGFETIDLLIRFAELCGNAYLVKVWGGQGYPVEMWPAPPQHIRIIPSRSKWIDHYTYGRGTEIEDTFKPADVMHLRYPNPHSVYYGLGPLSAAVLEADTSRAMTAHAYATMENGAQPGLIVASPKMTANTREEVLAEIERRYMGPNKAGRSLVLRGIGKDDIVPWAMGKAEMGYLESAKDVRDTIAAIFDVSVSDLTSEDVNRANAEAGAARQERRAVRPRMRRLEEVFNLQVLPDFFDALGDDTLFVCADPPEAEADAAITTRVVALKQAGILTVNEARSELMYESISGGDELVDERTEGMDDPEATEGQEPGEDGASESEATPAATGTEGIVTEFRLTGIDAERAAALCGEVSRGEQSPEVARVILLAMGLPSEQVERAVVAAEAFEPVEPEPPVIMGGPNGGASGSVPPSGGGRAVARVPADPEGSKAAKAAWYWLHDDHAAEGIHTKDDDRLKRDDEIERIVADWYAAVISAVSEAGPEAISLSPIRERFAAKMREVLNGLLLEGASAVGASFDVPPTNALAFLDNYTLRLTGEIAASTEEQIRLTIRDGLATGKTNEEIRVEVMRSLREQSPFRAERIARYETAHALNMGNLAGYKELGYSGKEIILSVNPCEVCVAIADQFAEAVGLDVPFLPLGGSVTYTDDKGNQQVHTETWDAKQTPPFHQNCRCLVKGVR